MRYIALLALLASFAVHANGPVTPIGGRNAEGGVIRGAIDADGNFGVSQGTSEAGGRNHSSTTGTDYLSTSNECWPVTVDTATDSTTVYNGPAVLQYAYVNTVLSAHTVLLVDGSTTKLTLPASMAAGSSPNIAGTMFRASLVVDPDNSSTGNITVCFRPLDADSTWTP